MYKFSITSFIALLLFPVILRAQENITFIENVNVIPINIDTIYHKQRVIIEGDKILKIEPNAQAPDYHPKTVIDGTAKYLIPGLVEMHYHLQNDPENELKLLIANGITTVRNMAEYQGQDHITIREKVKNQEILGPRYFTTGPYLRADQLKTMDDVLKVSRHHKERGYDFLKIADNLPKDIYLKLLEETHKLNIDVVGHAQHNLPLEYSLRMKSIEHMEEFMYILNDEQKQNAGYLNKVADELRASGAYVAPTLGIFEMIIRYADDRKFNMLKEGSELKYLPKAYAAYWSSDSINYRKNDWFIKEESLIRLAKELQWQKEFTKILFDHNIPLLAGSDTYGLFVPGFSLHHELELISSTGISPYETLKTATVNPARYLNTIAVDGTISEGKLANLVLLNQNPLEDIRNIKNIQGVMLKGHWLNRDALDNMLEEVDERTN